MQVKKIKINVKTPYEVIIGENLLLRITKFLSQIKCKTIAIITDKNVISLYEPIVRKSLDEAGYSVISFAVEGGEKHKTAEELFKILNFLADNKITRSDIIIALGGGIVGDMTGLAAGIYLRGIRYIQVPTTFLAAVDSSVGGKTAVNLNAGKNLAGLFYQPQVVICDTETFKTLDDITFTDGVSEAVKHGFIYDEKFFRMLQGKTRKEYMNDIIEIVARNVEIKGEIVAFDEFENARRQLLNFGHTAAHAIEKCTEHAISHGQAVMFGMIIMSRASYKKGFCEVDYSYEIKKAFSGFSRNNKTAFSAKEMYKAGLSDKKRSGEKINIIVPKCIGKCVIKQIKSEELLEVFEAGLEK